MVAILQVCYNYVFRNGQVFVSQVVNNVAGIGNIAPAVLAAYLLQRYACAVANQVGNIVQSNFLKVSFFIGWFAT